MNIEDLLIQSGSQKRHFSASDLITALTGGGGGGGGGSPRLVMTASYQTSSNSPTVFYTGLRSNGDSLTPRTSSGIIFVAGLYTYLQDTTGITDFIAVWDEGDVNAYSAEWIAVDT